MIDPGEPQDLQIARQAKIIDALVRRAERQHELGNSAYAAFQSAIALQEQVWAKTRDLELAAGELEQLRYDRERARKNLSDALSVMEGGFGLFADGKLQISNDLFRALLPDIADQVLPGLTIEAYFDAIAQSRFAERRDERFEEARAALLSETWTAGQVFTFVVGLDGDRWFQFSLQKTTSDNLIILQTEITAIVRKNRSEKDDLIDMQAHYLQAAFDHMSLGIGTFSREGTLLIHNARFREFLDLPANLVKRGTHFSKIVEFIDRTYQGSVDVALGVRSWPQMLHEKGVVRERLRHGSGRILDLHVHRLPDRGFLVDIADTTLEARTKQLLEKRVEERTSELTEANRMLVAQARHQTQVEEQLRQAKEEAEAAVSSKTRFLAAASHDLLQPINAAKLLISTLVDMTRETNFENVVERLEGSFTSMESLLHALLDISRLESAGTALTPTDVCLGPLMETVIEDQAPLAARKGVKLDVVPSSAWVRSDQRYLLRSIQNLVVNAIQYTERGRVLVGCRRRQGQVVLQVWDTGMGISTKDQKRIFEEFTRADNVPVGSGMGLGLSIVDRTCRHLGHNVTVRSKPGVGSVFSIVMDEVPAPAVRRERPARRSENMGQASDLLVLVIENDSDVLFATVQKLEGWGASAFGTRSTKEALEVIGDIGVAPDIILADYQLDGGDTGIKAIQAVRAATGADLPAIMITADRSTSLQRAGAEMGFSVLPKPVDLPRLRRLINKAAKKPVTQVATDVSIA